MGNGNRTRAQAQSPPQQQTTPPPARPVHEVRLGRVKAAVWMRETEHGVRYAVSVCQVYKDQDQKWQTTDYFGRDELLVLAKVADMAHTWICEHAKGPDIPL